MSAVNTKFGKRENNWFRQGACVWQMKATHLVYVLVYYSACGRTWDHEITSLCGEARNLKSPNQPEEPEANQATNPIFNPWEKLGLLPALFTQAMAVMSSPSHWTPWRVRSVAGSTPWVQLGLTLEFRWVWRRGDTQGRLHAGGIREPLGRRCIPMGDTHSKYNFWHQREWARTRGSVILSGAQCSSPQLSCASWENSCNCTDESKQNETKKSNFP